ncbi:MAG: lysoplasmalogenase family protein [Terracoccus sp.]
MTTPVWVLLVSLAITSLINWVSVARGDLVVGRITTPTFMVLLLGLAWALHGEGRVPGAPTLPPVLLAVGLGLAGDLALLRATRGRYLLGLGAFVASYCAYGFAILESVGPYGFPWLLPPALLAFGVLFARWGRDVVRHAGPERLALFASQLVLGGLVAVAGWRGDEVVVVGALLLVVAATVVGHDRFVLERRWAPVQGVAVHHVAHVLVVVGLLR